MTALAIYPSSTTLDNIPPVKSGGLIEASRPCLRYRAYGTEFPPVNSGGLIEAW